ncbi:MAG: hypothetical protein C0509_07455, partial [Acinetobacter sp.]|nr:hypothetical protein [Acinetobacter sp.]
MRITDDFFRMEARGALIALSIVVIYASVIWFVADVDVSQWLELFGFYVSVVFVVPVFLILIGMLYDFIVSDIRSKGMVRPLKFFMGWLSLKWHQYYFLSVLWPLLCLVILVVSFNVFKQTILLQKGFLYDDMLVRWDRFIFSVDPGVKMHELVDFPWLTLFMDQVYHAWFFPMLMGVMLVAVYGGYKLRLQYMLTWVSCWILLGSVMAWLIPSAGPCFYDAMVGGQYE